MTPTTTQRPLTRILGGETAECLAVADLLDRLVSDLESTLTGAGHKAQTVDWEHMGSCSRLRGEAPGCVRRRGNIEDGKSKSAELRIEAWLRTSRAAGAWLDRQRPRRRLRRPDVRPSRQLALFKEAS